MSNAVHFDCLAAVQTTLRGLSLAGVADASIVVKKLPLERVKRNDSLSYPLVIVTPEQVSASEADNVNDDIVYGVGVNVADDDNQERTAAANLNKYLLWLEQIRKAFAHKRLSGVASVYTCHVSPFPPVSSSHWAGNLWASGHLLKFVSRENRT